MKLTALKIGIGDSFLLEVDSKKILVDTGNKIDECKELLTDKKINTLDFIAITHYDSDHINGLLSLLESDILIKEIWLPETFGRICKSLKEEKNSLLKDIINRDIEQDDNVTELLIDNFSSKNYKHIFIEMISGENIESDKIIAITHFQNKEKESEVYENIIEKSNDKTINIIQPVSNVFMAYINKSHIDKINKIVEKCKEMKKTIKWLKYTGKLENKIINEEINILGVNCTENKNIKAYIDDFETIFYLTRINRESLVFKYHSDNYPNILFSADSGFEFLNINEKISLKNNSIVTAAHHGSKEKLNVRTYDLVEGDDLIYVRSDNKNDNRPCCEYIKLDKKYCTICNTMQDNDKKEIILEYCNNKWDANKDECKCDGNKYNPSC